MFITIFGFLEVPLIQKIQVINIKQGTKNIQRTEKIVIGVFRVKHNAYNSGTQKFGPARKFAVALVTWYKVHVNKTDTHYQVYYIRIERGHRQVVTQDKTALNKKTDHQARNQKLMKILLKKIYPHLFIPVVVKRINNIGI